MSLRPYEQNGELEAPIRCVTVFLTEIGLARRHFVRDVASAEQGEVGAVGRGATRGVAKAGQICTVRYIFASKVNG